MDDFIDIDAIMKKIDALGPDCFTITKATPRRHEPRLWQ